MSACEVRVIKPGTIWQLAFVCLHHKCISLGCACSAFAYGSQFVGGDGCVCVGECVRALTVQYVYQYAKQGALNGF